MSNKKKMFFKTFACFSFLSLSTSSIALASKSTQDFTNVITFGDSFADIYGKSTRGAFLNYDLILSRNENTTYTSALNDFNYFTDKGVLF